jgi:hypothetical protein
LSTSDGRRLEKIETATLQTDNTNAHNNKEPSCAPQTADNVSTFVFFHRL